MRRLTRLGGRGRSLRRPRHVLVTGGARSGKSTWAESVLAGEREVTYLATAARYPDDPAWQARLDEHRARRPASWRTIEFAEVDEAAEVLRAARGAVLLDDVGNWLTRALDVAGAWDDPAAVTRVRDLAGEFTAAFRETRARVVAVTNEVGSGVVPATRSGAVFRDELGRLNAGLAGVADAVVLVACGIPCRLR